MALYYFFHVIFLKFVSSSYNVASTAELGLTWAQRKFAKIFLSKAKLIGKSSIGIVLGGPFLNIYSAVITTTTELIINMG